MRDGSSAEKAILAGSISFEYDWMKKRFPGAPKPTQKFTIVEQKPYDILTVMYGGREHKVYFDISKFFMPGVLFK